MKRARFATSLLLTTGMLGAMACSGPLLRTEPAPPAAPEGVAGPNQRLAPRASPLAVGAAVPAFQLLDQNGVPVSAGELMSGGKGALVIICPPDNEASIRPVFDWARQNAGFLRQQRIELLLMLPHSPEENAAVAGRENLRLALLSDPRGWVMRSFGTVPEGAAFPRRPHSFLLGPDGRIHLSESGMPGAAEAVMAAETLPGQQQESIFQLF